MNRYEPNMPLTQCRHTYMMKGGNFLDTANNYHFQESEKWLGEWMKKRGVRDEMGLLHMDSC